MEEIRRSDYLPVLIPMQPETLLGLIRNIVREELRHEEPKRDTIKDEALMNRKEVAHYLKISLVTLHDWMNNRGMPSYQQGGKRWFLKSEVMEWLKVKKSKDDPFGIQDR